MSIDVTNLSSQKLMGKSVYTVAEIQKILDIGRVQAYNLVKARPFVVHEIGKKLVIPIASFNAWLYGITANTNT